jgi:hypothetical protein
MHAKIMRRILWFGQTSLVALRAKFQRLVVFGSESEAIKELQSWLRCPKSKLAAFSDGN